MASLNDVTAGSAANSSNVQQIIDVMKGTVGSGNVPVSLTATNDSANFALDVRNLDNTNSRGFRVRNAAGTAVIQQDINGVALLDVSISSGSIAGVTVTNSIISGSNNTITNIVPDVLQMQVFS